MLRRPALALAAALLALPAAAAEAREETISSFDGTPIVAHWFPQPGLAPGAQAPTVLTGPGWGSPGADDPAKEPIAALHAAGYNVLTWDPRGFGRSGGVVTVNSAGAEGRDVQALLDWLATQPQVQLDGPGDPRAGMTGGSYGGGIQLVTASIDRRVDAIVPNIAWNSLRTSLYRGRIVKQGWSGRLYAGAASRPLDPHIASANEEGVRTGSLSAENEQWFAGRGPGDAAIRRIEAPTLIQQGTVDTLFTLGEAVRNFRLLRAEGTPVSMLWFCGGHGICLTDPGDRTAVQRTAIAWLDRYVKRDTSVATGPRFAWIDQDGKRFTAPGWPVRTGTPITATSTGGRLRLVAEGGAGPVVPKAGTDGVGRISAGITPARARNAVNVQVRAPRAAHVIGAPRVTLTYRGRTTGSGRPQRVFAQLVDARTKTVLGNQITPVPVKLDGRRRTTTVPLELVAHSLRKGGRVTLQLVATTVAYATPQLGGSVTFERVRVSLPTLAR